MTNLNVAIMNLETQVEEYANHLATKDYAMASMKNNQPSDGGNNPPTKAS